ncbi:MAG TPA: RNA-binding protein [Chthoniobacterales bacterium]
MKLYVGNLSFNTTADDLQDAFQAFGTVSAVDLISDRDTGRSRGFAFVTMGSRAEGKAAIEGMQGRELDGRTLSVNEARPKEERSGGGGGNRSGGRPYSPSRR